jgi:hypothetical protein
MNKFQQASILHLAEKLVDYVYKEEEESYWGSGIPSDNTKEDWIDEEELNASRHNFKIVYNLNKLIIKIKAEQL